MPFVSRAQQGYLYANEPAVAKKFAAETGKETYKKLPRYVNGTPTKKKEPARYK